MKAFKNLSLVTVVFIGTLNIGADAKAQWLSHTATSPGASTSAVFSGLGGAYAGVVDVSLSNVVDGGNNGVPGLVPGSESNLTPTFLANYPTNLGGDVTYLQITYNNTQDAYRVTFDFTGLANGYLPIGTTVGFFDIDILENAREISAIDTTATLITTPWLSQFPGTKGFLDLANSDGDQSGLYALPTISYAAGSYDIVGNNANDNGAFLGYQTTQNIAFLSFKLDKTDNASPISGTGGYWIVIAAVPEPSSIIMFATGAVAFGIIGRRRMKAARAQR